MDCEFCCVEPATVLDLLTDYGIRSLCEECQQRNAVADTTALVCPDHYIRKDAQLCQTSTT